MDWRLGEAEAAEWARVEAELASLADALRLEGCPVDELVIHGTTCEAERLGL